MKKNSDKRDWENYLNNPSDIFDKDQIKNQSTMQLSSYKFDFHGYTISSANQKLDELIPKCYDDGVKELLLITGKGLHSDNKKNVYVSESHNKLQNTIPEYINSNEELLAKVHSINKAPKKLGGDGVLILKLKNKF